MRLDPVAVGVDDKGSVIAGAVVGAQAGRAIVAAAGFQRGTVESVDAVPRRSGEVEVQTRFHVNGNGMLRGADPESDRTAPVAERSLALAQALVTERLQRRVIEAFCFGDIADAD